MSEPTRPGPYTNVDFSNEHQRKRMRNLAKQRLKVQRYGRLDDQASDLDDWDKPEPPTRFEVLG